ncbi:MAG TPA: hypothetical protein VEW48_10160 [Thermoanaerobaculia bacterium]|nr:hypothetical protein [Thermoanaerobaculia bacterium]
MQPMLEALRREVERSLLSRAEIEQALAMPAGTLDDLFTGKVELGVAHVFGILRVIGAAPWDLFLGLQRATVARQYRAASA